MSVEQPTFWDYLETTAAAQPTAAEQDPGKRRAAQRRAFKRLRSGGHWQIVLKVARSLPQPFTLNDLSIACWRHDRAFFGMKGHEQFPDNHKIHSFLYGKRGLIQNGLLLRVQEGLFRVPDGQPVAAAEPGVTAER